MTIFMSHNETFSEFNISGSAHDQQILQNIEDMLFKLYQN